MTLLVFCQVRAFGGEWVETILRDLSCTGFRMAWNPSYRIGSRLTLQFAHLGPMVADVRWRGRREIGCRFTRPLSSYVLDHIVDRHGVEAETYRPRRSRLAGYRV